MPAEGHQAVAGELRRCTGKPDCLTFGIIPALLCFMYVFQDIEVKLKTLVAVSYSNDGLIYLYIFWLLSVIGYMTVAAL